MIPVVAISVVIPTHERREAVLRAIHSVLDQHTPPAQVVVIDDGSTDGTADAIDALGLDIVKVFWQENRGPSAARNAAIARCSSDVVAFLDSDNTWHPHHLDFVCELFRLHPDAALVATQRNYHFGDETPRDSRKRDMASLLMLDAEGVAAISAVAARREALITAGGFDERMWYGEDIDLFLRLALAGPFVETAATTVEVASDPEGLKQRGLRTDGYA